MIIKNCPFCGDKPKIDGESDPDHGWAEAICINPECHANLRVTDGLYPTTDTSIYSLDDLRVLAIKNWNKRAS